jgi:hypothetical protein
MAETRCPDCRGRGGAYAPPEGRWRWCRSCGGEGASERALALDGATEGAGVGIRHDANPRRLFGD